MLQGSEGFTRLGSSTHGAKIPIELHVSVGSLLPVTLEVNLRDLLPSSVLDRLTSATAIGVKPVDLLTKTKLTKNKKEAKALLAAGKVQIDGTAVLPGARQVNIHLGSTVQLGDELRARLVG